MIILFLFALLPAHYLKRVHFLPVQPTYCKNFAHHAQDYTCKLKASKKVTFIANIVLSCIKLLTY